ncbi:hypothetical protein [Burkholderia sp. USMB20]|uniref:hypothetical protein n=1 Tax=Burkholderia sp. USMB20 TaxID=1571773 RepID=UPI000B018074|nr:hypothetical protein [Burkholderia sp. USMB20]TGN96114.1 hypothetical protein PL79_018895 [Burkholderia sp. USMB20]
MSTRPANAPAVLVRVDGETLTHGQPLTGLLLIRHDGHTYGTDIRIGAEHNGSLCYPALDWRLLDDRCDEEVSNGSTQDAPV